MVVLDCSFNPLMDVCEVDQFGFFDLAESFLTGTISSNISIEDLSFSDIEDPKAVSGKPKNVFEFIDAGVSIQRQAEGVQLMSSAVSEGGD